MLILQIAGVVFILWMLLKVIRYVEEDRKPMYLSSAPPYVPYVSEQHEKDMEWVRSVEAKMPKPFDNRGL
jgi:hypothetical protein